MTRDDTIRIAREAGLLTSEEDADAIINYGVEIWLDGEEGVQMLERFAALVAALAAAKE